MELPERDAPGTGVWANRDSLGASESYRRRKEAGREAAALPPDQMSPPLSDPLLSSLAAAYPLGTRAVPRDHFWARFSWPRGPRRHGGCHTTSEGPLTPWHFLFFPPVFLGILLKNALMYLTLLFLSVCTIHPYSVFILSLIVCTSWSPTPVMSSPFLSPLVTTICCLSLMTRYWQVLAR